MTKTTTTLTISAIAAILIIGGFTVVTPNAFSTYGGGYHDDDDDDDCNTGYYGHHDDDDDNGCGDDKPDDPCDCEKPDTLKFTFMAPEEHINTEFRIEVYKKLDYVGNEDKMLTDINSVMHNPEESITLTASSFHKDKLHSNTVFAVYDAVNDDLVATMEIHTSCSQPLYIGMTVSDNGYTLTITDGLKKDQTSIPLHHPDICEDETKPKQMGKIIVKKAITNDNGGDATPTDFTITLTNVETGEEIVLTHDQDESTDPKINVNEVPVGKYTLSETVADDVIATYTSVLIAGDTKCPSMPGEEFTIKKGKKLSCTIYNDDDFVEGGNEGNAPTMKITVQVNNLDGVSPDQFEYTVGTETLLKNGDTVTIPTNTAVMFNQTNFIDDSDPENPAVLPTSIEGDGNCPDVLGTNGTEQGFLTLSANQNIECIVVYGKVIEPGVIFHFDSVKFDADSLSDTSLPAELDQCDASESNLPCIYIDQGTGFFNVVPNLKAGEQLRVTTLVLLNVIPLASDNTMFDSSGGTGCNTEGISTSPNGNPTFTFQCSGLFSFENQFRGNFALIETLLPGKEL